MTMESGLRLLTIVINFTFIDESNVTGLFTTFKTPENGT